MNEPAAPSPRPHSDDPCPCLRDAKFGDCCGITADTVPKDIFIQKEAISKKKCDEMVRYLAKQPRTDLGIVKAGNQRRELGNVLDSTRITFSIKPGKLTTKINNLIETGFSGVVEDQLGKTLLWYETPTVLLYVKGGWYARHTDSGNVCPNTREFKKLVDRDYSVLLYLSDKFEGGNITFNRFGYSYKPQRGDLVVFPSDNRYAHTAERVTAGNRYAVVSFCAIEESKKIYLTPPADAILIEANRKPVAKSSLMRQAISDVSG
ncbi:2OG-Fe(II) oxygenase [Haliea sp. E17]|uniref:2OG-Fe(II) oxygenase n=1 Tax=Haliea sp. E17 TaxID=3401576 RepID=UPI003AAAE57F